MKKLYLPRCIASTLLGLFIVFSTPFASAQPVGNGLRLPATATATVVESATIATVSISGNTSIPEDALAHNLKVNGIVTGQPLNPERLDTLRGHIIDHYQYFRRDEAEVEMRVTPLSNGLVDVELYIHEYSPERGLPEGYNDDPYADDIYRENTPPTRTTYAPSYQERQDGYYLDDTGSLSGGNDLAEGTLSLGAGYGNKGALFKASFIKRQLFGSDASLRLSGFHDRYESNIDLGISKPNFLMEGVRLDTNIFYDAFDNHRSRTIAPYDRRSYGIQAKLNFPIDRHSGYSAGLRYSHNRIKDIRPEYHRAQYFDSIDSDQWKANVNDFDFLLGWHYNNFNRKFLPTKGVDLRLDGSISLPGSDNKYFKVKLDAQGYYPIDKDESWLIGAKTSLGYADGMDGHEVPFYQNLTAGGLGTLRGFAYGTVGPRAVYSQYALAAPYTHPILYSQKSNHVVGGNALAAGSLELVVPSFYLPQEYRPSFRTSLFVDAASVWNTNKSDAHPLAKDNSSSSRVRVSAGLSLQWQFPLGVLSVSYAVPVKKYDGDRREQLQINLSGSF